VLYFRCEPRRLVVRCATVGSVEARPAPDARVGDARGADHSCCGVAGVQVRLGGQCGCIGAVAPRHRTLVQRWRRAQCCLREGARTAQWPALHLYGQRPHGRPSAQLRPLLCRVARGFSGQVGSHARAFPHGRGWDLEGVWPGSLVEAIWATRADQWLRHGPVKHETEHAVLDRAWSLLRRVAAATSNEPTS